MTHRLTRWPAALPLLGAVWGCAAAGNAFLDEPARSDPDAGAAAGGSPQWVQAVEGPPPGPVRRAEHLVVGDLLRVRVHQAEELSTEGRVDQAGELTLPLLGPVRVAGRTAAAAASEIEDRLRQDYMRDPRVDLEVLEPAPREVTVLGAVKRSGVYRLQGETTLLGAIALAQGFDPLAKESGVILFRKDAAGRPVGYVVDTAAAQRGESADPELQGGDRVVVPRSGGAVFLKGAAETLRALLRVPF